MTLRADLLEELRRRRAEIAASGGDEKIKERHEKGVLTARERLGLLFQPDTFQEVGMHIRHSGRHFGMENKELPADAVVTGTGYVNGQLVAAISQDFMVSAGTLGKMHAHKMVELMKFAIKTGIPVVAFKDSGGADGPMVLFTSLILAKDLFVPITVVGYLYFVLTYGGYPYLIKAFIPERLRGIRMPMADVKKITSG